MAENSPKHSVQVWESLRLRFVSGNYTSLKELSAEYGVHPNTLRTHIHNEKWSEEQSALQNKVKQGFAEKTIDLASEYLKESFLTAKHYDKLVKVSMSHLGSKDSEGNPVLDPDALDTYSKVSQRSQSMAVIALRLPAVASQVNVTGSISLVSIIDQLRQAKHESLPDASIDRIIDLADDSKP